MLGDLPERRFLTVGMEVCEVAVSDVSHPGLRQSEVTHLPVLDAADCGHGLEQFSFKKINITLS